MLYYPLKEKLKEHIKKEHNAELIAILKDYSFNLCYRDLSKYSISKEQDVLVYNMGDYNDSPYYRINMHCLLKKDDSYSFVLYQAYTSKKNDEKVVDERIYPIFENFTKSFYMNSNEAFTFIKDGMINSYNFISNKKYSLEFEGKACPIDNGFFYIINGNILNKAWIKFEDNQIKLYKVKSYEDEKEITYAKELDMEKGHFEDFWCRCPELEAILISFADGTKRLRIGYCSKEEQEYYNHKTSKYFDNLEYLRAYVTLDEKEYNKAPGYNTDEDAWPNYEIDFDKDSIHYKKYAYYVPGLTFKYTLGNYNGIYIVKNNGNQKIMSKNKINNQENK